MSERSTLARSGAKRLPAVDAARGVALLGMMAVHIVPTGAGDPLSTLEELARGRSSAAFAVLAGVALALAHGGTRPLRGRAWAAAAAGLVVRCLLIGTLGLLLAEIGSGVAVILVYYALLFALAGPLLSLSAPVLARLAVAACLLVPVGSQLARRQLAPLRGSSPVWVDLADPGTLLAELTLTGYYPVLAWTTYLLAGLAVGRLRLSSPQVAARILIVGVLLAAGASLASRWLVGRGVADGALPAGVSDVAVYGAVPTDSWWWLVLGSAHAGTPLDLAHTTGTSLALLGGLLLGYPRIGRAAQPLAWVGGMTLTLYAVHVTALAYGVGPDDPGPRYLYHLAGVLVLSAAWRSWAPRGPLEELVSWPSRRTAALARGTTPPHPASPDG